MTDTAKVQLDQEAQEHVDYTVNCIKTAVRVFRESIRLENRQDGVKPVEISAVGLDTLLYRGLYCLEFGGVSLEFEYGLRVRGEQLKIGDVEARVIEGLPETNFLLMFDNGSCVCCSYRYVIRYVMKKSRF